MIRTYGVELISKTRALFPILLFCSALLSADEEQPLVSSDGKWSKIQLQSADRIVFQLAALEDERSVVLSIVHLQDKATEKRFFIDYEKPIPGAQISYLGGGPTIGYAKGNFELVNHLFLIRFDEGIDEIEIPEKSFMNVPEYFRYVIPYRVSRRP